MALLKSLLLAVFCMGAATADTGAIWTPINNGLTASTVAIESVVPDPINPSVAYAFIGGAIYKTTDATATWIQVRALAHVNSLVIDPTDSNTLYAATLLLHLAGLHRKQRSHDRGAVIGRQRWQFMVWRAA